MLERLLENPAAQATAAEIRLWAQDVTDRLESIKDALADKSGTRQHRRRLSIQANAPADNTTQTLEVPQGAGWIIKGITHGLSANSGGSFRAFLGVDATDVSKLLHVIAPAANVLGATDSALEIWVPGGSQITFIWSGGPGPAQWGIHLDLINLDEVQQA